jgi:hypothetical protein
MSIAPWGMQLAGSANEVVERIESYFFQEILSFFACQLQRFHIKFLFLAVANDTEKFN